jgi:hypothetical protein
MDARPDKKMSINIIVKLDKSGKKLEITHPKLEVLANKEAQEITWWLFGDLADGSFLPINCPSPGFQWDCPIPQAFSDPSLGNGGKTISISDTNITPGPDVGWPYILRIFYNKKFYEIEVSKSGRKQNGSRGRHPVIINK